MRGLALALTWLAVFLPFSYGAAAAVREARAVSTRPKYVVAHFMVGNTYPYTLNNWVNDMRLALSYGIDTFALNLGRDYWQPDRVADAYAAADKTGFKLFLSFDMTSLPCGSAQDANTLRMYLDKYSSRPSQFLYDGKPFVSTFSGEGCSFGAGNLNEAWQRAVKYGRPVHFVPAFFVSRDSYPSLTVIDGIFNWNAGWPMGDNDISFGPDSQDVGSLGGKTYMAPVSPWFFTHYGPDSYNKNFIYKSDNWLLSARWEVLMANRPSVDIVQVLTWNDYGESHYMGPIEGAQPNSQAWVDGFDHTPWLVLLKYYIISFKKGAYVPVTKDSVTMWARLYPAAANTPDPVGKPDRWQFTHDFIWAVVSLVQAGDVTLSCGSTTQTTSLGSGVSKLKLPLTTDCSASMVLRRNGAIVGQFTPPGFQFNTHPQSYNFNAFVASSG